MTKPECATASVGLFSLGHLDLVILSSFVIGHSSLISINRLRPSMQPPRQGYSRPDFFVDGRGVAANMRALFEDNLTRN